MRRFFFAAVLTAAIAPEASAQIYKYKKKDGTVVYTDSLAQLPEQRRAHYNKLEQERERQRQEMIQRLGREEYERKEKERQLEKLRLEELDAQERARREAALNAAITELRARKEQRDASESTWRTKASEAKKKVDDLLADFNRTQESYQSLATKASFSLLPGQQQQMVELKEKLDELEKELDAAIEYLEFGLPEEARRAGVPPGWIR
jgi:hypothetical protein